MINEILQMNQDIKRHAKYAKLSEAKLKRTSMAEDVRKHSFYK